MLNDKEGTKIPDLEFKIIEFGKWKTVTTDDIFKGKNIVAFAVPGAFTPTCSATHLPRYNELAEILKENGVDDIVCFAVNDTFVMNEWAKDQNAENITFIPDGNGSFAEAMGALVDKSKVGLGKRSVRYSMLVKDKVIQKIFIEPEKEGSSVEVADADTMLKYINPQAKSPAFATLFTRAGCPHCARAKKYLEDHGVVYEEIELNNKITGRSMTNITGGKTTPQIYLDGKYIGTADDLEKHYG